MRFTLLRFNVGKYEHQSYIITESLKGPFIFYEVGGAGGNWGGHRKKNGIEGGPSKKIRERRGHVKYYLY